MYLGHFFLVFAGTGSFSACIRCMQCSGAHWALAKRPWAKVGNKCSCPPGKSGQKWAKNEIGNINIEKLQKNNKKTKCCKILCFVLFISLSARTYFITNSIF